MGLIFLRSTEVQARTVSERYATISTVARHRRYRLAPRDDPRHSEQPAIPSRFEFAHQGGVVPPAHPALEVDFVGASQLVPIEPDAEAGGRRDRHPTVLDRQLRSLDD